MLLKASEESSRVIELLDRLVSFPTVSSDGNVELINYVASRLREATIPFEMFPHPNGDRSSLFARVGPPGPGGVILSGHTDVVPVRGQEWTKHPFSLTREGKRLFGRGTADMKGFVACALDALFDAAQTRLTAPLYLALSYDEEIGCVGVRPMLDFLGGLGLDPRWVLIGEPTGMRIANGHKGKTAARATCCGYSAHSALAPTGLNAIHLTSDFLSDIRALQTELAETGPHDPDYDVPYSTVHAGMISGGTALNIVPDSCTLDFEIRNVAEDDPKALFEQLFRSADSITRRVRQRFPGAGIQLEIINEYPGLNEMRCADIDLTLPAGLSAEKIKVAFGTEGGLFAATLRAPVFVCGPGHMAQGHKPDEYIETDQLQACSQMLAQITAQLQA